MEVSEICRHFIFTVCKFSSSWHFSLLALNCLDVINKVLCPCWNSGTRWNEAQVPGEHLVNASKADLVQAIQIRLPEKAIRVTSGFFKSKWYIASVGEKFMWLRRRRACLQHGPYPRWNSSLCLQGECTKHYQALGLSIGWAGKLPTFLLKPLLKWMQLNDTRRGLKDW